MGRRCRRELGMQVKDSFVEDMDVMSSSSFLPTTPSTAAAMAPPFHNGNASDDVNVLQAENAQLRARLQALQTVHGKLQLDHAKLQLSTPSSSSVQRLAVLETFEG